MPGGLVCHPVPELPEPWQAVRHFIAGDQARIDGADRGADDPVRLDAGLVQCRIDAGLVGAERATALEDNDDLVRSGRLLINPAGIELFRGRYLRDACHFGLLMTVSFVALKRLRGSWRQVQGKGQATRLQPGPVRKS